jgi:hypothetical protein
MNHIVYSFSKPYAGSTAAVFFSLLLLCSIQLFAQQRSEPRDSNLTILRMPDPGMLLERPVFVLPFSIAVAVPEQNRQLPLFQSFAGTPQSFAWDHAPEPDLTAPLKLQLYQSPGERAFSISVSAAGTAGAAYILYRHIKKYGIY